MKQHDHPGKSSPLDHGTAMNLGPKRQLIYRRTKVLENMLYKGRPSEANKGFRRIYHLSRFQQSSIKGKGYVSSSLAPLANTVSCQVPT